MMKQVTAAEAAVWSVHRNFEHEPIKESPQMVRNWELITWTYKNSSVNFSKYLRPQKRLPWNAGRELEYFGFLCLLTQQLTVSKPLMAHDRWCCVMEALPREGFSRSVSVTGVSGGCWNSLIWWRWKPYLCGGGGEPSWCWEPWQDTLFSVFGLHGQHWWLTFTHTVRLFFSQWPTHRFIRLILTFFMAFLH